MVQDASHRNHGRRFRVLLLDRSFETILLAPACASHEERNDILMDKAKALVDQALDDVKNNFAPFTYPVYAFVDENPPIFIGTCFAFRYGDRGFLVTAAHVIDNCEYATLALGTRPGAELVTIEGEFHITNKINGSREEDPIDFAWHALTTDEAKKIPCIPESDLEIRPDPERYDRMYVVTGYPLSKNNKIPPDQRRARRLVPKRATYMNRQCDVTAYFEKHGMTSATHIAVKREHRALNAMREEENTIGHKGLSGGPVIDSGMRLSPPEFTAPKVSGIVIERDEKSSFIVAVRLSVVLHHISATIGTLHASQ
jgi:hypothetical protein